MASKLKERDERAAESQPDKAHAQRMIEFRRRAERISRSLEGRKHSDSAELLAEDRQRQLNMSLMPAWPINARGAGETAKPQECDLADFYGKWIRAGLGNFSEY